MAFQDLVSSIRVIRKSGSKTLVILPFYTEYGHLARHLSLLRKQTSRDFDLLIVMNAVTDETRVASIAEPAAPDFGIILAKRKEDTGSAGGFSAGQLYALENGYEWMVFTDSDCYPADERLIENLLANRQKGYVRPECRLMSDGRAVEVNRGGNVAFYSLLSSQLVREYGIYYAPIYYGADDLEYIERIRETPFNVHSFCQHPYPAGAYRNFDKYVLYLVHLLIFTRNARSFLNNIVNLTVSLPVFLLFLPPYGRKGHWGAIRCLLAGIYGKPAVEALRTRYQDSITEPDLKGFAAVSFESSYGSDTSYASSLMKPFAHFRKDIIIEKSYSGFLTTLAALAARRAYCRLDGKAMLLADNSNPLLHALRLALFPAYIPLLAFFFAPLFTLLKCLRQPKTMRYGLE